MTTSEKYDRISKRYDRMETLLERLLFRHFREQTLSWAHGDILEVGVGTGKNLHYYRPEQRVTAGDFSPGLLEEAEKRKETLGLDHITLMKMDVEDLRLSGDTRGPLNSSDDRAKDRMRAGMIRFTKSQKRVAAATLISLAVCGTGVLSLYGLLMMPGSLSPRRWYPQQRHEKRRSI